MKFSTKTKFKVNTFGGGGGGENSSNLCNQEMLLDHILHCYLQTCWFLGVFLV